ncbi:hypothetical protein [Sandarakinorhabdus sp. DWP1-3-1]|uniref:hypothetical protein n=1 Tax=Sandarakinorhabdus sp. DWP1-3-1 TaxID=2804627 RepID=UPI003CEA1779
MTTDKLAAIVEQHRREMERRSAEAAAASREEQLARDNIASILKQWIGQPYEALVLAIEDINETVSTVGINLSLHEITPSPMTSGLPSYSLVLSAAMSSSERQLRINVRTTGEVSIQSMFLLSRGRYNASFPLAELTVEKWSDALVGFIESSALLGTPEAQQPTET